MPHNSARTPVPIQPDAPPTLCIIIDTEEEFDWSQPFSRANTATTSIPAQHIAHQRIYDKLGIVPTYVIDWPVATTPTAWQSLKALRDEGRCEIGTHLHPWVTPPHTEEVNTFNSYTGNLPPELEFEKLRLLTQAILDNFQNPPTTFKAGRYGLGPKTFEALAKLGYQVDASIVPHTSFSADGGPDFRSYTNTPFWFGPVDKPLLELPVTTGYCGFMRNAGYALYEALQKPWAKTLRLGGIAARTGALERIRLTPEGCNVQDLMRLMKTLVQDGTRVLTLTYHSPSLVPGHTPYVRTAIELESFLQTIELACVYFKEVLGGQFLGVGALRNKMLLTRLKT